MKRNFQKVPISKAPEDFLIPLEALKPTESPDFFNQLSSFVALIGP